jgi:predicted house-cleaning noncanonical NTP pyrophosphatase (MazG superfamily)
MDEFDRIWAELEESMSEELKGLSQDEVNAKLTPLVVERVIKKLGVTQDEIFAALAESD